MNLRERLFQIGLDVYKIKTLTRSGLTDAPKDGKNYARKDGVWVEVVPSGEFAGTLDDIQNGQTYVKSENNFTDAEKTKLDGLSGGLTQAQIRRLI